MGVESIFWIIVLILALLVTIILVSLSLYCIFCIPRECGTEVYRVIGFAGGVAGIVNIYAVVKICLNL